MRRTLTIGMETLGDKIIPVIYVLKMN
jgi:hypothetical protein